MDVINRRDFCLGLGAAALMTSGKGFAAPLNSGSSLNSLPNIVYVLCDDLGWGDLEVYNAHSAVPTPHANSLAEQGRRFTDMHASAAVCTPSRYSILTGAYSWRSRLKEGVLGGYSPDLIPTSQETVPSMLKATGYYTAGVGKWHLGLGDERHTDYAQPLNPGPIENGFDYYFGIPASLDMKPYLYFENNHTVELPTLRTPGNREPRGVMWRPGPIAPDFDLKEVLPTITAKAVDVIKSRAKKPNQPFFLYAALPSPHTPWLPLPEYRGKSRAGRYGDYVAEVDAMLGRIMDALKETGLEDNTLLVFTSDHGADWRPSDIAQFEHRANGPWRGRKADVWEGGHRVPFITRWPGHIPPNTVSDELGSLTDLMATAAAMVQIPLTSNMAVDSYNLLPSLCGTNKEPIRHIVAAESCYGIRSIREGTWKLAEGLGSGGFSHPRHVAPQPGGPKGQLYDLANDPGERYNIYQQHPDIVNHLTGLLAKYERQGYSRPM